MAIVDVLSVNKTKYAAGGSGDNYLDSGAYAGPVRIVTDSYVSDNTEDAGSTISLVNIPKGAKILAIKLVHGAFGVGATMACGDAVSATRYFAQTSVAAAGVVDTILNTGFGYTIGTVATDDVIVLTTAGAALADAITVEVQVTYVQ